MSERQAPKAQGFRRLQYDAEIRGMRRPRRAVATAVDLLMRNELFASPRTELQGIAVVKGRDKRMLEVKRLVLCRGKSEKTYFDDFRLPRRVTSRVEPQLPRLMLC